MTIKIARDDQPTTVAAVTGVGTTQTGAPLLRGGITVLTSTAGQTAAILPSGAGSDLIVRVTGGTAATIFPPVGGAFNGGSANASVSVASGAIALFYPHPNGLDYTAVEGTAA
jgi:hypothetical protein